MTQPDETFEKAAALSAAGRHDEALCLCKEAILRDPEDHLGYFRYYTIASKHLLAEEAYSRDFSVRVGEVIDIGALLLEKAPPEKMPSYKVKVDSTNARLLEKENALRTESQKEGLRKAASQSGRFLAAAVLLLLIAAFVIIFVHRRMGI